MAGARRLHYGMEEAGRLQPGIDARRLKAVTHGARRFYAGAEEDRLLQVARKEGKRLQVLMEGDWRPRVGMEGVQRLEVVEHYAAPGDQNQECSGSLSVSGMSERRRLSTIARV